MAKKVGANAPQVRTPEPSALIDPETKFKVTKWKADYIEAFAKCIDHDEAAKQCALKPWQKRDVLKCGWVQREVQEILDTWRLRSRLTADQAAGRHMRYLDKIERRFDAADDKVAGGLANALIKGSSDTLRATNHFNQTDGPRASAVQVVINIGDDKDKPKEIEAEVVQEDSE